MAWIAVDWGTSNLRGWGLDSASQVVAEVSSDKGMAKLDRAGFEPALLELVDGWLPHDRRIPIIACGMVGARQGWVEVPYRQVPCTPGFFDTTGSPETRDPRFKGTIFA